jgi:hypothetical protein
MPSFTRSSLQRLALPLAATLAFTTPAHALTETVGDVVLNNAPHADVFAKDTAAGTFVFTNTGTPSVSFESARLAVGTLDGLTPASYQTFSTYGSMSYGFSVRGPLSGEVQVNFTGLVRLQAGGTMGPIPEINGVAANFSVASGPGNVVSGRFEAGPNGVAILPGGASTGWWYATATSGLGNVAQDVMPASDGVQLGGPELTQPNWINARFFGTITVHTDATGLGRGRADISISGASATDFTAWMPESTFQSASGFIDPYFSIDPATLAANPGVTLNVEPGMGNLAPVPEPATWAMLAAGTALLAGAARRRQVAAEIA